MAYAIPDPQQRRQLFHHLRRGSSWTAWARLGPYCARFVAAVKAAFEDSQQHPPPGGLPLVAESEMVLLLNG